MTDHIPERGDEHEVPFYEDGEKMGKWAASLIFGLVAMIAFVAVVKFCLWMMGVD